jgi:eukaryotic-like serine/threonine-protein kinase
MTSVFDDDRTRTRQTGVDMLPAGTVLADRYRIEEVIGAGGMGVVYRAHDQQLECDIAVKVLRTDQRPDETTLARLRREVLLARKVSHPNVVRLHDIGSDGNILFLTMDLVRGRTLREVLAEAPMSIDEVVRLGIDLAEALATAHDQGIIHRDLKPGNVLVDEQGRASILDFGVARAMDAEHLTRAGEVVGTPAYLSPEQVRGEDIDHRSDIFSLGLLLLEALTGRLPSSDGTLDEMLGQRAAGRTPDPARLVPQLPAGLAGILRRCLAARPEQRYDDASELARDLRARHGTRRSPSARWPKLLAAAGLVATVVLLTLWWLPERAPAPVEEGIHVAILPLANDTGRDTLDWARRSLAQGLAENLAEVPTLHVSDSLRVFRMLEDLGVPAGVPGSAERRQLFELLDLDQLLVGSIQATEDGLRLELRLFEPHRAEEAWRLSTELRSTAPLDALPDLTGQLLERLTGRSPTLPAPPRSENLAALEHFDQATELMARREPLAAIEPLEKAVESDPRFAAAWTRLAEVLAAAGHPDRAIDSAERAVALLADHGGRLAREAEATLAELYGQNQRAREILEALVKDYPGDTRARLHLAELLIDTGELEEAAKRLHELTETEPQNAKAWFLLGRIAIVSGQPDRAAEDYLVRALVIENRTGSIQGRGDVINALGIAHMQLGDLDLATSYLEQAIDLRRRIDDHRGEAATRANLAHLAMLRGDLARANDELAMAIAAREALGDRVGMADLFSQKGVLAEEVGDFPTALEHFREALRLHEALGVTGALADSHNNVAFAHFMLGRYDNARQFNRAALQQLEGDGRRASRIMALETQGYLESVRGQWDAALRAFLESLELSREISLASSEAVARGGIGLVAMEQGRFGAAEDALGQALAIMIEANDTRGQAIYQLRLADLELRSGRYREAGERLADVAERVEIAGDRVIRIQWLLLQGRSDLIGGRAQEARGHFEQALELATHAGLAMYQLRAEAGLHQLDPAAPWPELIERVERLGHAPLLLETLVSAAQANADQGNFEQAERLARRGLRPPDRLDNWSDNWRFHWVLARTAADSDDDNARRAALTECDNEIERLLDGMPEAWQDAFRTRLPHELAHVQVETQ